MTIKRSRVTSAQSKAGAPAPKSSQGGYGHSSDRMTKSGRLNVKDVRNALAASSRAARQKRGR